MKNFLLISTIFLVFMATASAAVIAPVESLDLEPVLQRMKRENCDYNACDRFCRRLKLPGGACINNKCKCDKF